MEKLKIGSKEFNIIPMGIDERDKLRIFTIEADSYTEVDQAFSDVSKVTVILEDDSEVVYLDCVKVTSIKDNKDGTYTVEVSTDAVERKITNLQEYTDMAICELTMTIFMMGGF